MQSAARPRAPPSPTRIHIQLSRRGPLCSSDSVICALAALWGFGAAGALHPERARCFVFLLPRPVRPALQDALPSQKRLTEVIFPMTGPKTHATLMKSSDPVGAKSGPCSPTASAGSLRGRAADCPPARPPDPPEEPTLPGERSRQL